MISKSPKNLTESDLEQAVSEVIRFAFPRLGSADIRHQVEFSIRLGHASITVKGRESWTKRGRADILLTTGGKPLAILELKRRGVSLNSIDGEQGLSYARLLPVMAPFVVVSNGAETRIIDTFSGQPYSEETPDAKSFGDLMRSATKVAAGNRDSAVSTLMGTDPQVWTSAVAAASARAFDDLIATQDEPMRPFGPLKIFRQATHHVAKKLNSSRLVLVAGPPLVGKTNVLEQLVRLSKPEAAGGLFLDCQPSDVFRKIADVLADTLDWPVDLEKARNWVKQISHRKGPVLVLAIDHVDPEDRDDVRMIEDLTSSTFGNALRVVVAVDADEARRLSRSVDGRRESTIGRRAAVVEVDNLDMAEYQEALKALSKLGMGVMDGGQYSPDLRRPWLLQAMATRLSGIERKGIGVFPAVPGLEIIAQARSNFTDPELRRRYSGLAQAVVEDAQDQSKPVAMALELLGRYFVRRATLESILPTSDIDWLIKQGYLNPSIALNGVAILTIGLPELLASELAFFLSVELGRLAKADPHEAAEHLAGAASNFLFGDIVGAQSFLDISRSTDRVPSALYYALADMTPVREVAHVGQHLTSWVEGVGSIQIRPQADGSTTLTINGEDHSVENDGHPGVSIGNVDAWLILSHLASQKFVAESSGAQHRLDPEALLLVGTADFVLRQPRNDILTDTLPTHESKNGGEFVCHDAGVVEAVTQSILKYLSRESLEDRDTFVANAMKIDSVYLTARLDIALRMMTRFADADLAAWANKALTETVRPAFLREVDDH